MEHTEFESVLDAARNGGEWAWTKLYQDLAGPLMGYLRTRGAREPEDLLGEVFLQLARNIGGFEGDYRGFRSWAFTVCHHRVIDERRASSRRPTEPIDGIADPQTATTSEDEAIEKVATHRVLGLLSELTDDQRDVLALRIIAGFRIGEIAEVTGRSTGAVKQLQRRGIDRLRETIIREAVPE